jgi:hypothetical protein
MEKIQVKKIANPITLVEVGFKSGNSFEMWFTDFKIEEDKWSWVTPSQLQRPFKIEQERVEYVIIKDIKDFNDVYEVSPELIEEAKARQIAEAEAKEKTEEVSEEL